LLACLRLHPDRMLRNLERSGEAITAENAMMLLAPALGRGPAHDLVHHALAQAGTAPLLDRLLADERVRQAVDEPALRAALDPAGYTGRSAAMAREMAAAARAAAARLHSADGGASAAGQPGV
jgi:3-carboxy-cis,cis-muconate cycloisomerase